MMGLIRHYVCHRIEAHEDIRSLTADADFQTYKNQGCQARSYPSISVCRTMCPSYPGCSPGMDAF